MAMKLLKKDEGKIIFETDMNISLANAIRRSVGEIPILAIDEVDIYKNDSALYDEAIAHRLGLIPIAHQKLKDGKSVTFKLKAKGTDKGTEVLSGELGEDVVYGEMPIVLLEKDQELELVARASVGEGKNHAKHMPGLLYYKHSPSIKISSEGEKHSELAELYPEVFEFDGKLKVKNAWATDLDGDDVSEYKGVNIELSPELVFVIESWGQIDVKDIFSEAGKALKSNLNDLTKALK